MKRLVDWIQVAWRIPKRRTILILWAVAVALVVIGSLLPGPALTRIRFNAVAPNDKLVHFMGYTVLALLPVAFLELVGTGLTLAVSMIPMGVLLEFLQKLVPGRSFEVGDMVANSLGVATGIMVALWLRAVLKRFAVAFERG